jgi:4-amino-4-deoxy-L-arabinose transferase-like glycosyltransferase
MRKKSSAKSPETSPGPWDRVSRWLTDHQRLILAVIVLASILVRLGYFLELNRGPCIWQHRWDQSDMNFFDAWAQYIAGGDWLTDKALHPQHLWHQELAAQYLGLDPEAALDPQSLTESDARRFRALWDGWLGGKTFHQEPLYPYLIALTYKIFGPEVRWVFFWQMLLGICSNILVYLIARRRFGVAAAAVAGGLAVLCSPLLFYELVLLREAALIFAWLGLVYLADLALDRGTGRAWLLTGLAGGLAVLLKSTFLPYLLGLMGLMAYRYRAAPKVITRSLALAAGVVLCLLPALARNIAVGAPALSLSSVGPITFICANAEDSPPELGFHVSRHAPAILAKTAGSHLASIVETLRTYPSPWSFFAQLGRKVAVVWHWYEIPNNENFYYYGLHSYTLRYLPVTFLILAPLALVGLALALGGRLPVGPLYLAAFINLALLLFSPMLSRLRAPLEALLIPFAALALVRIGEWLWTGRKLKAAAAITALALLSFWTMHPLPADHLLIRPADYFAGYEHYQRLAQEAQDRGDLTGVADILKKAMEEEPAPVRELGAERPAKNGEEARLAALFALMHGDYAQALARAGQPDAAREEERRAAALMDAAQGRRPRY